MDYFNIEYTKCTFTVFDEGSVKYINEYVKDNEPDLYKELTLENIYNVAVHCYDDDAEDNPDYENGFMNEDLEAIIQEAIDEYLYEHNNGTEESCSVVDY